MTNPYISNKKRFYNLERCNKLAIKITRSWLKSQNHGIISDYVKM